MNSLSQHSILPHQPSIVFKRWSRKGYAIFAGLHRHVVIGTLSVSICYASMLKIDGLITLAEGQTPSLCLLCEFSTDGSAPPGQDLCLSLASIAEGRSVAPRGGMPLRASASGEPLPPVPSSSVGAGGFSFCLISLLSNEL